MNYYYTKPRYLRTEPVIYIEEPIYPVYYEPVVYVDDYYYYYDEYDLAADIAIGAFAGAAIGLALF